MNRNQKIIGIAIAVMILFQLTIGTEPLPPPYHQYFVSGIILRGPGLPLNNFVVSLRGKFPYSTPDSVVSVMVYRVTANNERYPAVTDTAGRFYLIVATLPKADSLALEITAADKPTVLGQMIAVPRQGISLTTEDVVAEPGCSGCGKEPDSRVRVIGYQYFLPEQTINLTF